MIQHLKIIILVLLIAFANTQVSPTQYNVIGPHTLLSNIIKIGFSPNQQLMVALVQADQNIYVYNGLTYTAIDFYPTVTGDSAISFAFAPDNSFLIVGTTLGRLFSFQIVNNVVNPTPGTINQNGNQKAVRAVSVSSTSQIAAGGQSQTITLYTLTGTQFNLVDTITYGNAIDSLAYRPDGTILLASSTTPLPTFSSILTATPFTVAQINVNPTFAVSSYSTFYVQATATNIEILNQADNSVAGTIVFPNAKFIQISSNGEYLIAGDGTNVQAWNIATVATPTTFLPVTPGLTFGLSSSGSNLIIQTALTAAGFQQRGLCVAQQFYASGTNECNACNNLCTVCLNTATTCYSCSGTAFLTGTTCTSCASVINDCNQCQNQDTCLECSETGNFSRAPVEGKCVCDPGYYLDGIVCSSCATAMKGCLTCSTAIICATCDNTNNYIPDTTNNKCKCNDGFYPDANQDCLACTTLTGCLTCIAANDCTSCNPAANFLPTPTAGVCVCKDSYYLNGQACALCNTVIPQCTSCSPNGQTCNSCGQGFYPNTAKTACDECPDLGVGCIDCTDATTCSLCDATANFAPTPVGGLCVCANTYYLNGQTCELCSAKIAQCNTCTPNGAVCNSCLPGFFPDATGANCLPCITNLPGCNLCSADGTACTACDDTKNFLPAPVGGKCQCADTFYLNGNQCAQCNTKIAFCNSCSQDGSTCSQCQAGLNREPSPDNTTCVCDPFYYPDAGQICKLCDDIQKCKVCVNPDTCTTCNDVNHWIVTNQNTCTCMSGYYDDAGQQCIYCGVQGCDKCLAQNTCDSCNQAAGFKPTPQTDPLQCLCQLDRYKDGETCPKCSTAIDGCVNCNDAATCTLCDTVNHFQLQGNTCVCSSGYYKQTVLKVECTLCRTVIANCQTCTSKTLCTKCLDTFVSADGGATCKCPDDYQIEDDKCVEQGGLSPIVIVAIIVGVLAVAGAGVAIVKCYKKKKSPLQDDQYESLQKS